MTRNTTATSEKLYVTDPEKWLHQTSEEHELFCLVMFRGSWCKYDRHYLTKLAKDPRPEKLYLVAWTSEGTEGAKKADEEWKLSELGYSLVVGDDTNALAEYLVEDQLLPKLAVQPLEEIQVKESKTFSRPAGYPNGLVQPGMVIYAHRGNMVMHWEAKVEKSNVYGAANRPLPEDVWEEVAHRKTALDHGNAVMPIHGERLKTCTAPEDV